MRHVQIGVDMNKETVIKVATQAAQDWYAEEDNEVALEFTSATQEENGDWEVEFKVYGWLYSHWRVSEYKGGVYADIIDG